MAMGYVYHLSSAVTIEYVTITSMPNTWILLTFNSCFPGQHTRMSQQVLKQLYFSIIFTHFLSFVDMDYHTNPCIICAVYALDLNGWKHSN